MQNPNENKKCENENCMYHQPYMRPHYHVKTNDGIYVRYIVEKPKIKEKEYDDIR
jgi:hypothetical protein